MAPPPKKRPSTDQLLRRWEADKKSRIFLQLAEEYRRQDFVDAAVSVLKDGLKHHPNFQPAHVALARCYMSKGQATEAQAELERVHAKSPDNLLAGKLLIEVLEGRGEKSQALEVAKQLVPFAAFDDPEVEATAKRLEVELAGPVVSGAVSSTSTGTGGDTMDFGTAEFGGETTASLAAADEDAPILIDADAFDEDEDGAAAQPSPAAPAAATPPPLRATAETPVASAKDADSTHDEADALDASSTFDEVATAEVHDASDAELTHEEFSPLSSDDGLAADATHDELAAVGIASEPLQMPGSAQSPPEDLLGAPTAQPSPTGEDDLTSLTLAELYEAQDSPGEAAAIYEKLLVRRPEDAALRTALERCRAHVDGRAAGEMTGETRAVDPVAQAAETSAGLPKWEPAPATPAPVAQPAVDEVSRSHLEAMLAEYERWLTAVRAVR